jgi:hypothetical protein
VKRGPATRYQSAPIDGYAPFLLLDSRKVRARKRERSVQVRFALADEIIKTREGPVKAHAGDAIVTGGAGDQWPVPPHTFAARYRPQPPLAAGEPGTYLSLPIEVLAVRIRTAFTVDLPDDEHLLGKAGDWLVSYDDGSLAIVAAKIFPMTYDRIS